MLNYSFVFCVTSMECGWQEWRKPVSCRCPIGLAWPGPSW